MEPPPKDPHHARRAATDLQAIFAAAIAAVNADSVAVVDVRVRPGYTPAMASALTRTS